MVASAILFVKLLIPSICDTCVLNKSGDNVLGIIVMPSSRNCASISSLFYIVAGVMVYNFVMHHMDMYYVVMLAHLCM